MRKPEPLGALASFQLAEGPHWDHQTGLLFWVDIKGRSIHSYHVADGQEAVCRVPSDVGFAIPYDDKTVIAGIADEIRRVDLRTGTMELIAAPDLSLPGRFNDAKCDPMGRLWAGTMSLKTPFAPDAALYRFGPGGLKLMEKGLTISNGIGWSPDHKTMYLTDSAPGKIWQYDFDAATGGLANRRPFAIIDGPAQPDGLCVDSEGRVFSAVWSGWRIDIYNPNGTKDEQIDLPVPNVTSCCFGGDDLKTLFITTAEDELNAGQLAEAPLSGRIFTVECDAPGLKSVRARLF